MNGRMGLTALHFPQDDGIVVVMAPFKTTDEYLKDEETSRRRELEWGVVREPPAPLWGHQQVVTRLTVALSLHVGARALGRVCVSPVDVVLDVEHALVVQPDVVFISNARSDIVRGQIWGAPDLVAEVLSPGTATRDRSVKLGWYRRYGVREAWLVDPEARRIEVVDLAGAGGTRPAAGEEPLRSDVLPEIELTPDHLFG